LNVPEGKFVIAPPLLPTILPALHVAIPELTSFAPLSVTPPLMLIPPLAVTSGVVTVPFPSVNRPVTVSGPVPPSVPALRANAFAVPLLL
jgi:hypothetical protein